LIALPVVMVFAPGLSLALLPAVEAAEAMAVSPVLWSGAVGPVEGVALSGSVSWPSVEDLVLWAWALGAVLVLGRFALGVWTLGRWTREGQGVTAAAWTAPLARLPDARRPQLVASRAVSAPLSWGIPPGVVLIGQEQLARPEAARAVMAHELAHLQRGDWLFLVLSRVALALFWFNPLVWAVHASLSARSEEAADDVAVGELDRQTYARTLVDLARRPRDGGSCRNPHPKDRLYHEDLSPAPPSSAGPGPGRRCPGRRRHPHRCPRADTPWSALFAGTSAPPGPLGGA
jgi:Zn-dependent protease with chaperone function